MSMQEKFTLKKVLLNEPNGGDSQWDQFVTDSPQGTIFSESVYLKNLARDCEAHFVMKGDQIKAGVLLIKSNDGGYERHDDVIYSGLMFAKVDPKWEQSRSQMLSNQFQITEFVVEELTKKTKRIGMSLSPGIGDIRPFLWHNYHDPDAKNKFRHDLRYTSILRVDHILEKDEEETLEFKGLGSSRKQEIRYARRDNVRAEATTDLNGFVDLYAMAMGEKLGDKLNSRLESINSIVSGLLRSGRAEIFAVKNAAGKLVSAACFCRDSKRAYYLYGANHPENLDRYSGTIVIWDALLHLRKTGVKEIDLEGVNSPQRGWFKLSFGGELVPYHMLTLEGF